MWRAQINTTVERLYEFPGKTLALCVVFGQQRACRTLLRMGPMTVDGETVTHTHAHTHTHTLPHTSTYRSPHDIVNMKIFSGFDFITAESIKRLRNSVYRFMLGCGSVAVAANQSN